MAGFAVNIGAHFYDGASDDHAGVAIGASLIGVASVTHLCVGTVAGTGAASGDAVVTFPVAGTTGGTGAATGAAGFAFSLSGACAGESVLGGFLLKEVNLVLTGGASGAGTATGSLWVSKSFMLNDTDYRVELTFDPDNHGILMTRTNTQTNANDNYWYDLRTKGYYPEDYQQDCRSYSNLHYPHSTRSYRGMLIGGGDGYIHTFDHTSKNDRGLNVDEGINSYFLSPPISLGDEEMEGKMTSLILYLAGASLGDNAEQSDGVSYSIYVADSIEEVYEKIKNDDTPQETGTVTLSGRNVRKRTMVRGAYAVIKIYNSNDSETWGINKLNATILPAGRIR